jgi:hypothetical protein
VSRLLRKLDLRRRTEAMAFSAAFADRPSTPNDAGTKAPAPLAGTT